MNPKISIIVPVYNVENYLRQCLDSLINQTLKEIEIICVNDGSKDGSQGVLEEYAALDDRVKVLYQENQGVSVARNNALSLVTGQYFMYVDSDDWLDLDTCEVTYNTIIEKQAECLMFSYAKDFGNHSIVNHLFDADSLVFREEDVRRLFHRRLIGPVGKELSSPQDVDIYATGCMQLFRTDKFVKLQFEDIRELGTFEDGLYQIVLYYNCKSLVYIDKPLYHYRKTNTESITSKHKPQLPFQWLHLFDVIEGYLMKWKVDGIYYEAFNNRIALSLIGLGLNQIRSNQGLYKNAKSIKQLLKTSRYDKALANLDIKEMPLHWKVFFFLCKHKMAISLTLLLNMMEYIRKHKR